MLKATENSHKRVHRTVNVHSMQRIEQHFEDKSRGWVDFKRIREIEQGIRKPPTKAEILIRTYSTGDSNTGTEPTDWVPSEDLASNGRSDVQVSSSYSRWGDEAGPHCDGARRSRSPTKRDDKKRSKSATRRALLHSLERPIRDIDKFVNEALGLKTLTGGQNVETGSCDSGLELDYNSLPRRINRISIESDEDSNGTLSQLTSSISSIDTNKMHSQSATNSLSRGCTLDSHRSRSRSRYSGESATLPRSRSKSKSRSKEKRAHFVEFDNISMQNPIESSNRLRSTSLDRSRLGTRSMSVFSIADSDCRSSDGISSDIFHQSELNDYRGHLAGGVRLKPKVRLTNLRGVLSRHDDLTKNFNRRQRETIRRVEYVFEKSHRQIETVLIDMKIDHATTKI